jgi:septal ring factor EnvC (AmiA/AmiB activator)
MKYVIRLSLIAVLVSAFVFTSFTQEKMTKEEWQKQITELTSQSTNLKIKLDGLQKEVTDLHAQESAKAQALKLCSDELSAIQGQQEVPFSASLDAIDARLNELSRLSNQDLWVRRAELDSVQKWINIAGKDPSSVIQKYQDRLKDQQSRLDGLKKTLEQVVLPVKLCRPIPSEHGQEIGIVCGILRKSQRFMIIHSCGRRFGKVTETRLRILM